MTERRKRRSDSGLRLRLRKVAHLRGRAIYSLFQTETAVTIQQLSIRGNLWSHSPHRMIRR
jgi:hypothetical protein